MVDIDQINSILVRLENFFRAVKDTSKNESDVERASYGLSKVESIKITLGKYIKNPQNKFLKQLDAGFVSVTRGVEYFNDFETNKKFYELCNNVPSLKQYIKW